MPSTRTPRSKTAQVPGHKRHVPRKKNTPVFTDASDDAVDVDQIHRRIVSREREEPEEGSEPTPWWVWASSGLLLFVMGFYLGRYGGSFSTAAHESEEPGTTRETPEATAVDGGVVFAGMCQACHQGSGLGIPGQYPPLAGSDWLVKDHQTPIRIVLRGLQGEIVVKGARFNNSMPRFFDRLSDEEIAAVLTHVRSSWGNNAPAVTAAQVDSVRRQTANRQPWSSMELSKMREETMEIVGRR